MSPEDAITGASFFEATLRLKDKISLSLFELPLASLSVTLIVTVRVVLLGLSDSL